MSKLGREQDKVEVYYNEVGNETIAAVCNAADKYLSAQGRLHRSLFCTHFRTSQFHVKMRYKVEESAGWLYLYIRSVNHRRIATLRKCFWSDLTMVYRAYKLPPNLRSSLEQLSVTLNRETEAIKMRRKTLATQKLAGR